MNGRFGIVFAGLVGCVHSPSPSYETEASWNDLLSREFRKHDSWVEWYVEQDYTDQNVTGNIHLKKPSAETVSVFRLLTDMYGSAAPISLYDPGSDAMLLADPAEPGKRKAVINSVHHELWHGFHDVIGTNGMLHQPGYQGPDEDDLEAFCAERVQQADFAVVRDEVEQIRQQRELVISLNGSFQYYHVAEQAYESLSALVLPDSSLSQLVPLEDQKQLTLRAQELYQSMRSYDQHIHEVAEWYRGWQKTLQEARPEERQTVFLAGMSQLGMHASQLNAYDELALDIVTFRSNYRLTVYESIALKYAQERKDLETKIATSKDPSERQVLDARLQALPVSQAAETSLHSPEILLDKRIVRDYQITEHNLSQARWLSGQLIHQSIYDCNELLARMYESIYGMYYGPPNVDNLPLTENDLAIFEQFVYEDEILLPKGLEKYRLGRQMLDDGMSEEAVKTELEYATSYRYKGKKYTWPEVDFTIVGEIPEAD